MSSDVAPPGAARRISPRQIKAAAACLTALILYTLAGFLLVPRILDGQIRSRVMASLDRDAAIGQVRFNPFTLGATIEGLRIADRDGADLVSIGRVYANLQVSGLFRWAWRFREVLVEQPVVSARILADGRPSIADLLETAPDAPGASGEPAAPASLPRLIVDRLSVTAGVVQFSDASRQPEYRSRFEPLNLDITDFITIPREGGEHVIAIGVGDGAELRWSGRQTVDPLYFTGQLDITGLGLPALWDYVGAGHVLDIASGRADIRLPYEIRRGDGGAFEAVLDGASAVARTLSVRPHDEAADWLAVQDVRVLDVRAAWPAARIDVGRVQIVSPALLARLEGDGALNWSRAVPAPPAGASADGGLSGWTIRVASAEIENGSVAFEDVREPDVRLALAALTLRARDVSSELAAPVAFEVDARIETRGTIEAAGTIAAAPLAADVTFGARGIDLVPIRPYLRVGPGADLRSGVAALEGRASVSGDGSVVTVAAEGSLEQVELVDRGGERLLAWDRMGIEGLTVDRSPGRARIRRVTLQRPFASILIDAEGRLNLTSLTATAASGVRASAPVPSAPAGLEVEVGVVDVRDGSAVFADESLLLPFAARIHSAGGTIRDLSTFAAAPATLALEGRVDDTGHVRADGTLRLSDPMANSEVTVGFRSIEMLGLTPYFAEFAGYAVREGVLDLDVLYLVKDRWLVGTHSLVARDLALGDRVQDSRIPAPGFAVRLAVALLKDSEGRINMDVPIEGAVDAPEFAYKRVFWNAVRTILRNAALAPFRALGRLFGRDEDDLELVEFDPGRSDLLPAEQETLAKLAEHLAPRPELTLAIEGRFDPEADRAAMQRAALDALIESRRAVATEAAAAAGESTLETILETLFAAQFSPDELQAERQRFTKALPDGPPAAAEPAAAPPAAAPAPGVLDAAGFYESLREKLLGAQSVTPEDLAALGALRATAIQTALTASGVIEPTRITTRNPAPVSRRRSASSRIASEMSMAAADEPQTP